MSQTVGLDHASYLSDPRERREVTTILRRLIQRGGVIQWHVLHEADGSCCEAEPWERTARRIKQQLEFDGVGVSWEFFR